MKTGIELIAEERQKQLENYSVQFDVEVNSGFERPLTRAAAGLSIESNGFVSRFMIPEGWDRTQWNKLNDKPYKHRLIIAGALIAAEIDRYEAAEAVESAEIRRCRVCGCTESDCTQCIEKQGHPCWWVKDDLCSSCQVSEKEVGND